MKSKLPLRPTKGGRSGPNASRKSGGPPSRESSRTTSGFFFASPPMGLLPRRPLPRTYRGRFYRGGLYTRRRPVAAPACQLQLAGFPSSVWTPGPQRPVKKGRRFRTLPPIRPSSASGRLYQAPTESRCREGTAPGVARQKTLAVHTARSITRPQRSSLPHR